MVGLWALRLGSIVGGACERDDFNWRALRGLTHLNLGWGVAQSGQFETSVGVAFQQHCCSLDTVAEMRQCFFWATLSEN